MNLMSAFVFSYLPNLRHWAVFVNMGILLLEKLKNIALFEMLPEDESQTCSNQMILSDHEILLITYFQEVFSFLW